MLSFRTPLVALTSARDGVRVFVPAKRFHEEIMGETCVTGLGATFCGASLSKGNECGGGGE
jgi:hypothetical protein